ncbi:MAG: tetratricopeptide repeat protein [Timaviella obliquedivisa GSE-PSE-MK23-08B]|nr:tetratricopeptide repeat protein [Timaviella obliquedivisa GSE-PSE-MK23-08B]
MVALSKSDALQPFDVFLCHNSVDKEQMRAIAQQLHAQSLTSWLDEQELTPGRAWIEILEQYLPRIKTVAIFIGAQGLGRWQKLEIPAFLTRFVEHGSPQILPVFLADAPQHCDLPFFLKNFGWVDFRQPDPMPRMIWGITGIKPDGVPEEEAIPGSLLTQIRGAHSLPRRNATLFVGRDEELNQLQDQLQHHASVAITAIAGMGGIGKTELALHYGWLSWATGAYPGGVCWVRSQQELSDLLLFARTKLDLAPPEGLEAPAQLAWCWQHWRQGNTLIVFDNVEAYADIEPFLPPNEPRFQVLLTTRRDLGASVQKLSLPVLSEGAALALLKALVGTRIDEQEENAKALCQQLGYLPLALELVGRYLARKQDLSVAELQQRLQAKGLDAPALTKPEAGMTATRGVKAAFELSWEALSAEAQALAACLSMFAAAPLEWRWVEDCLTEADAEAVEELRDDELLGLHLLQRVAPSVYQLHPLIREFFAEKLTQQPNSHEWKQRFCQIMVKEAKQIPQTLTLSMIAQFTSVIPHLKQAATALTNWLSNDDLITPATRIARFYKGQVDYTAAEFWYTDCLKVADARLGNDHPNMASSLNNLAGLYYSQGRYGEAEPLLVRSLHIRETQLGANHPDTAQSLNNLAELYESQGRYSEAESLLVRSLHIYETQLGADHPDTALGLNNLAGLYDLQGRYGEAEPLLVRSLHIRETQLGANHPDTALGLNSLALLYDSQGRYSEAEPLYVRSLHICETQLGADHPNTASNLNSLALLYDSQGRYSEAEPLYVRSLHIRETQLGANHPDTASSLNNLAELYKSQGRYSEAEPLYMRSLHIRETQLGADHPNTASSLNNLAELYKSQGRYSEAEPLLVRSLHIHETQLGADHPGTASSLNNLAGLYYSQGRYSEAEPLLVRSLHIRETQLGANHPDTALGLNNLPVLYKSQGRYSEAEPLLVRSLHIRETQLGANHPDTAQSLNNLAGLYDLQGRYSEAELLYVRSLHIYETQLGADHPDTALGLNNLAVLYKSQGRYSEAEPLYAQAIIICWQRLGEDHPNTKTGLNNFYTCLKRAIEAGQSDQLSDHPFTQFLLQQLQTP